MLKQLAVFYVSLFLLFVFDMLNSSGRLKGHLCIFIFEKIMSNGLLHGT